MPDFMLCVLTVGICIPGIWLMSDYSANVLSAKPDNELSRRALFVASAAQTLIVVALCAAAGVYLGEKVGIRDDFLLGLVHGEWRAADLDRQAAAGAIAGVSCTVAWLMVYYGYVRPRLDGETVRISEKMRMDIGLAGRVASGGITEEVIFRWGLLSAVMWVLSLTGMPAAASFWIGIVTTGILFGLAHLPGNIQMGCKLSPLFVGTAIVGNLWVALFCGYLLWKYGLVAAIIVHILFHVIWYPWDRAAYRKITGDRGTAA